MKRHLLGVSVFVLIVVISISALSFVQSLNRSLDVRSVPPVIEVDEAPLSSPAKSLDYATRFVQYDDRTRLLTARLEVERSEIGRRSTVEVRVAVDGSRTGFPSVTFPAMGKVLPGNGEKAVIVVEKVISDALRMSQHDNHYAAFSIPQNGDSLRDVSSPEFGFRSPIVFAHPQVEVRRQVDVRKGPVILQ